MTEAKPPARLDAIDLLRGLAVIGMSFSGMVAARGLPAWMYHAQNDPKAFGITWVDLVFPFFLFSMGAAIPIVIEKKLALGESHKKIVLGLGWRSLLLAVFSILGQHWRPYAMQESPTVIHWLLGLLGFGLLATLFYRWPSSVPVPRRRLISGLAFVLALGLIGFIRYPEGIRGFANYRNDPVLMVLANVSFSAGVMYLLTRKHPLARAAVFVAVAIITLTCELPGLGKMIWDWAPTDYLAPMFGKAWRFFPVLYHFEYHKYLLIVLPGVACGQLLSGFQLGETGEMLSTTNPLPPGEGRMRAEGIILILATALVGATCAGLLARELGWTLGVSAACVGLLAYFLRDGVPSAVRHAFWVGVALLGIGLLAEPIGGGIRKDGPTTLSYYFVSSGLAFVAVAALSIQNLDRKRWLRPIASVGQNPILGYLVITNLVTPICGLMRIEDLYGNTALNPWLITAVGAMKTIAVIFITRFATSHRIFCRA